MWLPKLSKKSAQILLFSATLLVLFFLPKRAANGVRSFAIDRVKKGSREAPRVIYREAAQWSSTLWINVGADEGVELDTSVLYNGALIGLVDRVEKRKSRVLLLTDGSLIPSVRVARGDEAKRTLLEKTEQLATQLRLHGEPAGNLDEVVAHLRGSIGSSYLAKGELRGSSAPLWRSRSMVLKGVGFNYDYADEHGGAREISTGTPYDGGEAEMLIQVGDLLVTTGLDGVFPPGLKVALVSHVEPLQEGAPSFNIEAKLLAGNLDEVDYVTLLINE